MVDGTFEELQKLFKESDGNYEKILAFDNGLKYLKLRSISKAVFLKKFAIEQQIAGNTVSALLPLVFEQCTEVQIEEFIETTYELEKLTDAEAQKLVAGLSKVVAADWGDTTSELTTSIISDYVKNIDDYDVLLEKLPKLRDAIERWTITNWYNLKSNQLTEGLFKDHPNVLPAFDIRHIDFFWHDVPFDLKTTLFPHSFIDKIRKERHLKKELSALKEFARKQKIDFETDDKKEKLIQKISDSGKDGWLNENIYKVRISILTETAKDPKEFVLSLYEGQDIRRFGDENRFFLILVDENVTVAGSRKLKREVSTTYADIINEFLGNYAGAGVIENFEFTHKEKGICSVSKCCVLFIYNGKKIP